VQHFDHFRTDPPTDDKRTSSNPIRHSLTSGGEKAILDNMIIDNITDPGGRALEGVGLQPLDCWDCGFQSRRGQGCLSLVSVVCRQVDVSETGRSLVQRSPI
jgi:hypothetical protein